MPVKPGRLGRPVGPTHKTHEERSAATRLKLIEAAIHCLRTYGYAATSTTIVAEVAGLSRGAMLHQFGTKVDLMLAVTRHVVDMQNAFFAEALKAYEPGKEQFLALTDVTWEALSQPSAIALLEIMMASRSDPDLGERFPALAEELAETRKKGAWRIARQAGITDRAKVDAMGELHRAAMQGLSILMMFTPDQKSLEPALDLLREYKAYLADRLLREAMAAESKPAATVENNA